MTLSELRALSVEELRAQVAEQRTLLVGLEMKRHARRLDKTSELGVAKKGLARALTILSQKTRTAEQGAQG
jgi:ribosomal protein L29